MNRLKIIFRSACDMKMSANGFWLIPSINHKIRQVKLSYDAFKASGNIKSHY